MTKLKRQLKKFLLTQPRVTRLAKSIADADCEKDYFVKVKPETLFRNDRFKECLERAPGNKANRYIVTDCKVPHAAELGVKQVIATVDGLSSDEIANSMFFVYFTCDSDALPELRKIAKHGGQFVPHFDERKTSYRFVNRLAYESLKQRWAKGEAPGVIVPVLHENLCEALELTKNVEGDFVEIGVFRGGSAFTAMNFIREQNRVEGIPSRKAWLIDTFDGFNYVEAKESADVFWAGTHGEGGPALVKKRISDLVSGLGVPFELVQSNICADDLPAGIRRISVANVDVDMYEATLAALSKCAEKLASGGIIICEDAASTPALYGAYLAMHEFLESESGKRFLPIFKHGQYFLINRD